MMKKHHAMDSCKLLWMRHYCQVWAYHEADLILQFIVLGCMAVQ
jgi:hypothetical protein